MRIAHQRPGYLDQLLKYNLFSVFCSLQFYQFYHIIILATPEADQQAIKPSFSRWL